MIRDKGLGIAIKVSDGTRRAVTAALFGVQNGSPDCTG